MISIEAVQIINIFAAIDHRPQMIIPGPHVDAGRKESVSNLILKQVQPLCDVLQLQNTTQQCHLLLTKLSVHPPLTQEVLRSGLADLRATLCAELRTRFFLFIPADEAAFFNKDNLFGSEYHPKASKEVNDEINAAGTCISLGSYTAAMFHLMRVLEFGLRALARHLKVKKVKSNIPLEHGTWEELIRAIEGKNAQLMARPRGFKRQNELDFYSGLLIEMRTFKDYWRNAVMHTRASYDKRQALDAFEHVRNFMQRLATKVS